MNLENLPCARDVGPGPTLSHEQFIRLFLQAEHEILRCVMSLIPNRSDARDVVQETAVALWRAIDKYDTSRPFAAWACGFALNEARMFVRSESRRRRFIATDVAEMLGSRRSELALHLDVRREHLQDCLEQLPEAQRQLVRAYYFEEDSVEAMSERSGRCAGAIYKSLQRIRAALHGCIERKLHSESP